MTRSFAENVQKYAELVVKLGVNIQPGQDLVISVDTGLEEVVHTIIRAAYEAGARNVYVDWRDPHVDLLRFLHAPDEAFEASAYPAWKAKDHGEHAERGAAFLNIFAPNPDIFSQADPARVAAWRKAAAEASFPYQHYTINGEVSWTIMSVPTPVWAAKLFPELSAENAVEKLWALIFKTTRVNLDNPVEAWHQHIDNLGRRAKWLNDMNFKTLHYTGPGTDLEVDLPAVHSWIFAQFHNQNGVPFIPNMPTEEVFTTPARSGVRGTVTSTKPLNYNGVMIENFSLIFENGEVMKFTAEKGYDALKNLLQTDEGAKRLGEIALVPHDSPISNSNVIFFNTLFDENASCHIALGASIPITVKDGVKLNQENMVEYGFNQSMTHVDFMIGSAELNIDGITESGERVAVFRNGNWA